MISQNTITINPVANGWLVVLPYQLEIRQPGHDFRKQAEIMKEVLQSDDFLNSLREAYIEEEKDENYKKDENVFIFKEFE